jgi:hypothetical protein
LATPAYTARHRRVNPIIICVVSRGIELAILGRSLTPSRILGPDIAPLAFAVEKARHILTHLTVAALPVFPSDPCASMRSARILGKKIALALAAAAVAQRAGHAPARSNVPLKAARAAGAGLTALSKGREHTDHRIVLIALCKLVKCDPGHPLVADMPAQSLPAYTASHRRVQPIPICIIRRGVKHAVLGRSHAPSRILGPDITPFALVVDKARLILTKLTTPAYTARHSRVDSILICILRRGIELAILGRSLTPSRILGPGVAPLAFAVDKATHILTALS